MAFKSVAELFGSETFLRVDKTTGAAGQSTLKNTGIFKITGTSTTDPIYDSGYLLAVTDGTNMVQLKFCLNTRKILYRAGVVGSLGSWITVVQ